MLRAAFLAGSLLVFAWGLCGCTATWQSTGGGPVGEYDRTRLRHLTLIVENAQPGGRAAGPADIEGAASDRGRDTAIGWIAGSTQGGAGLGGLMIGLIGAPFAAVGGAVYGGVTSVPENKAYDIGVRVSEVFMQQLFVTAALQVANSPDYQVTDKLLLQGTGSKRESSGDHPGEPWTLHVVVRRWRLNGEGKDDPRLRLEIEADVNLTSGHGAKSLYSLKWRYNSPWRFWSEWIADNGKALSAEISALPQAMFEAIFDDVFRLTPIVVLKAHIPASLFDLPVCGLRPDESGFQDSFAFGTPRPVYTTSPLLKWESFPRPEDLGGEFRLNGADITNVTYEVRIWRPEDGPWGHNSLGVTGLKEPQFQVRPDLSIDAVYAWSVRARFQYKGEFRITHWMMRFPSMNPKPSDCPHSSNLGNITSAMFRIVPRTGS